MMKTILKRRSVRKFDLSKRISSDILIKLCKAGEAAPSARNQRGREYVIIDDTKVIQKLSQVSVGAKVLEGCTAVIAVIGKDPKALATPLMQDQDLSCAVENILLAATSLGVGSCYIGIYPIEERMISCNKILGVKDSAFTFALIALGYPEDANAFYEKDKWSDDLLHFNRY